MLMLHSEPGRADRARAARAPRIAASAAAEASPPAPRRDQLPALRSARPAPRHPSPSAAGTSASGMAGDHSTRGAAAGDGRGPPSCQSPSAYAQQRRRARSAALITDATPGAAQRNSRASCQARASSSVGEDGAAGRSPRRGSGRAAPRSARGAARDAGPTPCGRRVEIERIADRAPARSRSWRVDRLAQVAGATPVTVARGLGPGKDLEGDLDDGAEAAGAADQRVMQQEPGGVLHHLAAAADEPAFAVDHARADEEVADAAVAITARTRSGPAATVPPMVAPASTSGGSNGRYCPCAPSIALDLADAACRPSAVNTHSAGVYRRCRQPDEIATVAASCRSAPAWCRRRGSRRRRARSRLQLGGLAEAAASYARDRRRRVRAGEAVSGGDVRRRRASCRGWRARFGSIDRAGGA